MKKTWMIFTVVATLLLALAVCTGCTSTTPASAGATTTVTPASPATTTMMDGFGRAVTVPVHPEQIIGI